ncbi:unnamed protein product [Schistosoma rodhaini]|nr:unnamed protein product [Schistosoma rodhaini]
MRNLEISDQYGQLKPAYMELEKRVDLNFHVDRTSNYQSTTLLSFVQPLTMTQLVLWTQEPWSRLQFLASLCGVCRVLRGGSITYKVFAYTLDGDLEVTLIMRHLMSSIVSSLLYFTKQWTYDGHLNNPYQEFHVEAGTSVEISRSWCI